MKRPDKRQLGKATLAQTFKFDCDRFLRLKLATPDEKKRLKITDKELAEYRPGIGLVMDEGVRWETEKYQDLIDLAPPGAIESRLEPEIDQRFGRRLFAQIPEDEALDILRRDAPPALIFQPKFLAPQSITPALEIAYQLYELDKVHIVPDILWIKRRSSETDLIKPENTIEYEIHVIDVKMAAEPNLRHFAEVTFYTIALAAWLEEHGLAGRYAVSAQGLIFPGSHDQHKFRRTCQDFAAKGAADAVAAALTETLIGVPHEVYQTHVRDFFENRLLRVLAQTIEETEWHVCPKSQTCDYVGFCQLNARDVDHLSRLAWLTHGQARVLRANGIKTTRELAEHIRGNSDGWQKSVKSNHQLRAERAVWLARADALHTGAVEIAEGRKSALMPRWSDMNIYLTIHSDPGTGITFAMGAKRVYFTPGRSEGEPPQKEARSFIVDRVDQMNTDSERERLVELIECVSGWLEEAAAHNRSAARGERKATVHFFFWDAIEIKQLKRMIERHLAHPSVVEKVELLMRMFPPDNRLPDPEMFRTQPGTIVKEVFRTLFGLPVPHDYTLLEVANSFYPRMKADGKPYKFDLPYGFKSELSKDVLALTDQIPFERAYELWQGRVLLTHYNPLYPKDRSRWRKYTRVEIYNGLQNAVQVRLDALSELVERLRREHKDKLLMRKSAFDMSPVTQKRMPEESRQLVAFTRLNLIADEIRNRQERALPIEERESRFISMRGLQSASGAVFERIVNDVRNRKPHLAERELWAMTFARDSRDARIREGDFLLALTNENTDADLDVPIFKHVAIGAEQLEHLLEANDLNPNLAYSHLGRFLRVEVAKIDSTADEPYLVLAPQNAAHFVIAEQSGLIDFSLPMVLDPVFDHFREGERIENVFRQIGGAPPPRKGKSKGGKKADGEKGENH